MKAYYVHKFEAIVYSRNRVIAARCAKAFAELSLDWVMPPEPSLASDYLLKQRFDFVLIDLDSPEGRMLLQSLILSRTRHGAVLAITAESVDAATLRQCYDLQIFYPTRPDDIVEEFHRALPLAERLSAALASPRRDEIEDRASEPEAVSAPSETGALKVPGFLSHLRRTPLSWLGNYLGWNHSFSALAQERFACGMASVGAIWFVQSMTRDFRGFVSMGPPPLGPVEMIALSLLLWICAKYRRLSQSYLAT